ncbi:hypothetical protein BC939DRAFT_397679 [Gamsiella multidivaricata]|uniref:uncharacterized protein n=1 Tax=Gamsiella multidivaricata TaxID=101098 RepID=UPI00221EE68B|nr:uncharacterized protein BC939DRAFT_397679 [Gamsiella multidivaricata]KAI7822933.1 hypothetical protein BC939DRAFT_397679 [Gamsiella multidivaricata]
MPVHNPYSLQQPPKLTEFTAEEKARLNVDLAKYLPPEFAATRPGPGRSTLTYIEGWRIKNLANKLFGFDGWSSAITDVTVDFLDIDHEGKVSVGVSVMVRVSLKDGTYHEDIGYGSSESQKSKASSFEKAKKEATTDGLKRALTAFGNVLGTCLYDKNFCRHLSMQKVDKVLRSFETRYFIALEEEATVTKTETFNDLFLLTFSQSSIVRRCTTIQKRRGQRSCYSNSIKSTRYSSSSSSRINSNNNNSRPIIHISNKTNRSLSSSTNHSSRSKQLTVQDRHQQHLIMLQALDNGIQSLFSKHRKPRRR